MIYNAVANVAARVFASFDAVMFQPGKYDVPAVLNRIKSAKAFQDEDAETAANEIVKIEIGTFVCSFRAVDSFKILKRLAAAYQIPTAGRAQFTKKADAAPVAVSFRVFAGLKDLCSRVSKDTLHPCFNYICVDTKRRALIVCDGHTLSAVPVPDMYTAPDAKDIYLITPAVLKAGRGVCNIDVNGTATNGAAVSAVDENIKYPNISRVLFAVPSEFITLGKKAFSELKKNVSAAAKFGKIDNTPVILKADAGANEIEIIGYRENETETAAPQETRRAVVSLPQPVPFAFAVAVDPERLGKVLAAEKMYLKDPNAPVCFVDETRRVFSVMNPCKDLNHTPFFDSAFIVSVAADSLAVDDVAGTFAPVQDAPAAPFEDEETAPAVPAVSEDTKITYITKNYVPVITDEIRDAVAVAAKYKYTPYYVNKYGVRCSREHTATVCGAELLLQRENLYFENYALICGNGQTFAYISKHDEEIIINYDVAQDEETANVETPAVSEDAQETAANVANVPAATLEDAGEISVKLCERIYNDTAAPVAIGATVIYNKFKGETPRRAVVTGYDDTIKMYLLETEDGQNIATGRDGFAAADIETPATPLQEAGEISGTANDPAAVLPEWLKVGARVRTRGRFMMSTHGRPEWVEGEEMTVKAINADFVELESRDESGTLRGLESVATATAADELTPIYSASEISQPAESEPAAVAASIDTNEPEPHTESTESTESTPTRAKAQTYQDKPDADTLPDDLPADVLKFYEVNRDASDENPAPVCLFWHNNTHSYTAYGSDAHILRDELGKGCATFTTETEYKHGKRFPAPIDFADIERDELPAALHWLTREGYAVAVFVAADCLPTLNPAAPDWQERDRARRDLRYSERLELGDGVTRIMESERNMYDCHYNIQYRYYRNGELLALFNATGYPEKWDVISTLRPPHAGYFSTGRNVAYFGTIYEAERFMLAEIAQGLQPYHRPTDPTPDPSGEGVGVCHSYDTNQDTATLQDAGEITDTAKTEPTRNQEIAKIILQQLGGRQFAMMTGAKQFVAIDNGVRFRIGRNATRANLVKIVLRGDDTYNMEFWLIGQEVNPYTILMRYANNGLSEEEFNKQVKAATERAEKAAESVKLKAYEGIYCDQLQELFTQYTELYTRLF